MIEARLLTLSRDMLTYQVQQTWRAKRPKTVVNHDLENPSIHRVRNGGKLAILFHPSPKNITEKCRSLS